MSDTVWEEFGIDTTDKWDSPSDFAKRVASFCGELKTDIVSVNSMGTLKNNFVKNAEKSYDAKQKADDFISHLKDEIANLDPEVVVHVLNQMKSVEELGGGVIIGAAMRTTTRKYSRKRAIAMYRRLRDAYNTYCNAMSVLFPEQYIFPIVPPLTGNYSDNALMGDEIREFVFSVDGEVYLNWYYVARVLNIEISSMMDCVEAFEKSGGTINGHDVELFEL